MDVDAEGNTNMPPNYSARFANLNATSMQIAEQELAYKDAINPRLSQSHRLPFLPHISAQDQQHDFPGGTPDRATIALMQSRDDPNTLRNNL